MRRKLLMVVTMAVVAFVFAYSVDINDAYAVSTAAKHEPPDGTILSGVDADQQPGDTIEASKQKWDDWTNLMGGSPAALSHTFLGYDGRFGYDFDVAKARGATPLVTWQTGDTSPKTISEAGKATSGRSSDEIILKNAKLSTDYGKPVFLRIDHEMNAYWFSWSSYNKDRTQRSFSGSDFKRMWQRMHILFEGGYVRDMNAKLAALGMPPLDTGATFASWYNLPSTADPDSYFPPAENVAFVFTPVDAPGIPDVEGNRWLDYYPGDEYVDWVGQTTYNTTWNASMEQRFEWLEDFYQEFSVNRGKPYMFGEWGLEPKENAGFGDNPSYINEMLTWTKDHPKVKALVYFSALTNHGDYRLSTYPNSAKALADGLKNGSFTTVGSSGDTTAPAVADVAPEVNQRRVSRYANVVATFSEMLNRDTLTTSSVQLFKGTSTTPVQASVTVSSDGKKATLDPSARLAKGTVYQVKIKGGTGGVKDLAGNALVQDYVWSFKTRW